MARQVTVQLQAGGQSLVPGDDFLHFSLTQRLAGHHSFLLSVPFDRVEGPQTAFFTRAPEQLLGQALTVNIQADEAFHFNGNEELRFKGLITGLGTSQDNDYAASIRVQGYSPCRQLADGLQKRTFVQQTLTAIFQQVLQPYPTNGLARRLAPTHTAPLPYIVQYQESNFAFLSRLAAEYGEWFYYDGQTLHLGPPPASQEIELVADGEYNSFQFDVALQPTRVTLYDYNYAQHQHFTSETSSQQLPALSQHRYGKLAAEQSEQLFTQPAHTTAETLILSAAQLNAEAKFLKAHRVANLVLLQGRSDNPSLQLGGVIRVSGQGLGSRHLTTESFGTYRLIELTHHVDARGNYRNTFVAIPHLLDVPPLQPGYAPPQGSPELAEVIDEADPQQLGRLRVRYYWPVARPQDAETDWLRVLTPYSGQGKGYLMKPEVGSQVLVAYQGGLAEQPFVLGNLFHAKNPQGAKYSPAQNNLKGIQTAGGNKVVMQEAKGAQSIHISNSNNKGTAIQVSFAGDGSVSISTNGPINLTAGGDITLQAGKNITLQAGEDISLLARKNVRVEAQQEHLTLKGRRQVLVSAAKDDLTLEAAGKKVLIHSTDNTEIKAAGLVKLNGEDVKLNE